MKLQNTVILVLPDPVEGPMVSKLPSFLHPVAGRPLIWHAINGLLSRKGASPDIQVLTPPGFPTEILEDLSPSVAVITLDPAADALRTLIDGYEFPVLVAHGSASVDPASIEQLAAAEVGSWIGGSARYAAAALLNADQLLEMFQADDPLAVTNDLLSSSSAIESTAGTFLVRSRQDLARLQRRIRDQLIQTLMENGATFLLPESVYVDVDVRIGRDSVIYPGVVIEGQTTIGEETVVGPGCRIVDSWIGSGVELKGWNYVAHASVRNRAILEPYVRRGFD